MFIATDQSVVLYVGWHVCYSKRFAGRIDNAEARIRTNEQSDEKDR